MLAQAVYAHIFLLMSFFFVPSLGAVGDVLFDIEQIDQKIQLTDIVFSEVHGRTHYLMHDTHLVNEEELRGRTLRVVVPSIEPPYINYVNISDEAIDEMGYSPGIVMEILKEVGKCLNLDYVFIEVLDNDWGSFENGTWTGAFGHLIRGEADLIAGAVIMQYDRSLVVDLTYPFQYELTGMMIRSPDKYFDNTLLIVTEPFKWEVWGLTAASIVFSGTVLKILTLVLSSALEVQYTVLESMWVFFSIFVQQGLPLQPKTWTCRSLLAFWWFASITLMATFTGSLVALFAVEKTPLPFTTIDQLVRLVKAGKYTIVFDDNSQSRMEIIAGSNLKVYQDLWHEMKVNHRVRYSESLTAGAEMVKASSGFVLFGPKSTLEVTAFVDCDVIVIDEGILPVYFSIPFAKNSSFSSYFSTKISEMVERGFVEKWLSDYKSYVSSENHFRCNDTAVPSKSKSRYLGLDRAQGAFWVLLAGIGLSLIAFAAEHVFRRVHSVIRHRRKVMAESPQPSMKETEIATCGDDESGHDCYLNDIEIAHEVLPSNSIHSEFGSVRSRHSAASRSKVTRF